MNGSRSMRIQSRGGARAVALLFGLALALSAQQAPPSGEPREIDGHKTPERIPDRYAYQTLFALIAGPAADEWRGIFTRDSGLSKADAAVVVREAERFQSLSAQAVSELAAAKKSAPRPLPPEVVDQYRLWNQRMNSELDSIGRLFERELSLDGDAKFATYLLRYVKPSMTVHLGDEDLAAGLRGDPTVPSARPGPAPHRPSPQEQRAAEAAIEAAGRLLLVRRITESERDATIELWNAATKPVVAFSVANCAPSLSQRSGLDTFGGPLPAIAPGATHELNVSKLSRPGCTPFTPQALAVIFDDGTSTGLPPEIERMKFARIGRMAEVDRVNRILSSSDPSETPVWRTLLERIGQPPDDEDSALQTLLDVHLTGVEPAEIKSADREARSALVGEIAAVRGNARFEVQQLASGAELGSEARMARLEQLRQKYRTLSRLFEEFRQSSAGSLYR